MIVGHTQIIHGLSKVFSIFGLVMACEIAVSNMALHEGLGRLGKTLEGLRDSQLHPRWNNEMYT